MKKKEKIFSKEFPVEYETVGDWIVLNIIDKFAAAPYKELYLKLTREPEYEGRDNDLEFSRNYWAMNIKGNALIARSDLDLWIAELSEKYKKIDKKSDVLEFYITFDKVWRAYGPDVITRSKKLQTKINRNRAYEKRKAARVTE